MTETEQGPLPFARIVWPLAVGETIVWAAMFYSFPALLLAWERDLGWSKTELSGAFTLSLVVSAVSAPIAGRIIDRGHGRRLLTGASLTGAALLVMLAQVESLPAFYAVWLGLGAAMSGCLYEPCFAVVTRYMGGRARRAITRITLVAGFAGTVSFPSAHVLTGWLGWRGTVLVFAAAVALAAAPLLWSGCRQAESSGDEAAPAASTRSSETLAVFTNPVFWLLAVAFGVLALDHIMLVTHLLPLLDERGVSSAGAVLAASMIGPMQVVGRLVMIAVERHVSMLGMTIGCYCSVVAAAFALLGAGATPLLLATFVLFQGAGWGVTSIARPVMVADLLGRRNFGVTSGLIAAAHLVGTAVAPTLAALFWRFGGYDVVIWAAIGAVAVGLVTFLAAVVVARRNGPAGTT